MYSQSSKTNFCFSYKRPGTLVNCCTTPPCQLKDSILTSQMFTLNNQKEYLQCVTKNTLDNTIHNILENQGNIQTNLIGQLHTYATNRNNQYIRLPPPFIPPSVIQLQMQTATVGIPKTIVEPCSGK